MTQHISPDRIGKKPNPAEGTRYVVSLRNIAIISAAFALILCIVITINFVQVKRADPLNTRVMKVLIDRMHENPADEQLRQEIREIDLLARKAFFTNQWQVRTGGYLLFFSILVAVICLKTMEMITKTLPVVPAELKTDIWTHRMVNRKWVAYTGISIVIISFLLAFLTHRELGKTLDENLAPVRSANAFPGSGPEKRTQSVQISRSADSAERTDTVPGTSASIAGGYPAAGEISSNFPSFRGPGGNGVASQRNIPVNWDGKSGRNILWKTEIPLPGFNSPVIWNDRVFLSGASESKREVYCVDLSTGKFLWRKSVEQLPGGGGQAPKIIKETGYCAPTMTTDGRRVYAIFANGDLIALDFEGKQVWAKNLGMPLNHYGHSSSLIMYHDLLIIQYDQRGSGSVMALEGKTGKTVWQTSRNVKISWASPVIVNTGKRTELILAADPMVASYNPADGKELWHLNCISGEVGPSVACADGVVYSVNDFSKLSAIQTGDQPAILWESTEYLSDIPSPLATEKYLILTTSYGTVVCYDAKKGSKYWEQELETPVYASPMLAEGKVYLMDKKGVMHIFKADQTYSIISQPSIGEGSSCTPAFADGKIIIRGDKNLYCIGH